MYDVGGSENVPVQATESQPPAESLRSKYERLAQIRDPYLRRARLCSKLTIPSLVVDAGYNFATDLPTPFQSMGAFGVNSLAAKLTMTVMPPNAPFFQFKVEPYVLEQLTGVKMPGDKNDARQQVEQNLVKASEAILTELETTGFRVSLYEAMRHLVVAGNALIQYGVNATRVFHLDQYVVRRQHSTGRVLEIITHERLTEADVPLPLRPLKGASDGVEATGSSDPYYDLYTCAQYTPKFDAKNVEVPDGGTWCVYQELEGCEVPNSREENLRPDEFEYLALRVSVNSGQDYSDSYVHEFVGDLMSDEGLAQSIVEGAAASARVIPLVNPAGLTNINEISGAANGQWMPGRAEDVTFAQVLKTSDFQVAGNTAKNIESRLAQAFQMSSSVQRQAERVTAEEIRFMAQELEEGLGGVYTLSSKELQLPLIKLVARRMKVQKRLPPIPEDIVKPSIVTGIDALGRGNDLGRLTQAFTGLNTVFPNAAASYCDGLEVTLRYLTAAGIRTEGLVKTKEQLQQEQQDAQRAQMIQQATGPAAGQIAGALRDRVAAQADQQQQQQQPAQGGQ
jgi:hypothetical protein